MSRKRIAIVVATALGVVGLVAAPASAHVLIVDPPGNDKVIEGWAGGPSLPGNGKGLIAGGPTGEDMLAPAHGKGLNQACESVRSQGRAAADIWGPPGPGGCPHGTF